MDRFEENQQLRAAEWVRRRVGGSPGGRSHRLGLLVARSLVGLITLTLADDAESMHTPAFVSAVHAIFQNLPGPEAPPTAPSKPEGCRSQFAV